MPLDPNIILQAGRGVTPLKDPNEIAAEQAQRQMQQLQLQQAQQGMADEAAYRDVLKNTPAGGDLAGALRQKGLGKQAQQAQQFQTEQQKAQGERGKLVAEGMKNGAAAILANPTEENAIQTLEFAAQNYGLPQQMVDTAKSQIYASRGDPLKLRQLAVGWGGDAEKVMGKFATENLGGVSSTQRVNPLTGQVEVAATQARTQSPDNAATVAQSAANAALAAQTARRGQDMTNTASKAPSGYRQKADGTLEFIPGGPADPNTKPDGGKPLNDTQAKALQFGTRMQVANELVDALAESGVNASVPGSRAGWGLGATISALQPAQRQQLDQAKRDFINAVLRRESGAAISSSEFDNAEKQYFAQPGDSDAVIEQKKNNRQLATTTILEEVPDAEARIAKVRGKQKGGASGSWDEAPKGEKPKQRSVNVQGKDYMAELAPDGKYYVQRGGKWFEVR